MKFKYQRIAIFYPHKGVEYSNPTLDVLFEQCRKSAIEVLLFSPSFRNNLVEYSNLKHYFHLYSSKEKIKLFLKLFLDLRILLILFLKKPDVVIGVDPLGLIETLKIKSNTKIGYFSFELLFYDEIEDIFNQEVKSLEVKASLNVEFILIQDLMRKKHLLENNEGLSKTIKTFLVPVAPREILVEKPISPNRVVKLIFSGSFAKWSGVDFILDMIEKDDWNSNYHVTFHSRSILENNNKYILRINELKGNGKPVKLHLKPFIDHDTYCKYLRKFHIGLALYFDGDSVYTGKNITKIGLASGKLSTYAMVGLPIITSDNELIEGMLRKYSFGELLKYNDSLTEKIDNIVDNWSQKSDAARLFYKERLNPQTTMQKLLLN